MKKEPMNKKESVNKSSSKNVFFRFLAFHFTTPSSSCLQLRIWNFFVKKVNGF